MSKEMLDALPFKNYDEMTDKKIWFSRTKLKYGRIINEQYIEEKIARLGFEIVNPEKLPLSDQVKLISTSRIVAGFCGSQLFSAFLAKNILGNFKIFNRCPYIPNTIPFMLERKKINGDITTLNVEAAVKGDPNKNMLALEPDNIVQILAEYA